MGGGAIRTAAKAAVLTGYRSNVARRTPNLSNSASVSSTVHMVHDGDASPLVLSNKVEGGAVQIPAWELGSDWEEVSGLSLDPVMDPPPRLVFGPTPSLEEAKEATKDLKEAIDGVYFTNLENSKAGSQISDSGSTTLVASMPKHAVQAFSLLQGCPEAQSVVASIVSDPNVYNAVLKNNEVMSFLSKHQSATLPNVEAESTGENECSESVNSPDDDDTTKPSMFADIMQNIKAKVSAVVSNISDILNDFMGPWTDSTQGAPDTKSGKGFFGESTLGASFMALAVAVILIVLMKRA